MRPRKLVALFLGAPLALCLTTSAHLAAPQDALSRKQHEALIPVGK